MNIEGDDDKRLLALCEDDGRSPTAMVKRLIFLAYKALKKKDT